MLKHVLASEYFAVWPTVAMILMIFSTLLVLLWIFRPGAREKYLLISQSVLEAEGGGRDE